MPMIHVQLGSNVNIPHPKLINLYGCTIGNNTMIGPFVEIQKGVHIGNNCKIQSHTFICEGVTIEDDCFIGHHVCFINDKYPKANKVDWQLILTRICNGSSIGSGAIIMCGITIAKNTMIGAGAIVTKSTKPNETIIGPQARVLKNV